MPLWLQEEDLGVELPAYRVPAIQKMIVRKSVERARPVIIATQMLESMTISPVATRAEVNDVANSVIDGADAVMLSGETSVGKFPVKTVETMRGIIRDIEKSEYTFSPKTKNTLDSWLPKSRQISNSICLHASQLSEQVKASAIISMTYSGYNAIKMSSLRPSSFIYVFTNNYSILNKLSLVWGVKAYYYDGGTTTDQTIIETKEVLRKNKHIKKGDFIINLASMPASEKGMTNMVKLSKVEFMINTKLLAKLCEVAGAPGHENRVRKIVLKEIESYVDDISVDNMGNVIAVKKGKESKRVMIGAHMDEIGFIVTHIDDKGFVYFHTLGGFDPKTLTAQRVIIHGKKDVLGVMGSKAHSFNECC